MTKFSAQQQSQLAQIGVFLRETREQQGKSLEDIAIRTYIRPQLLNGIESGDPALLPEPIFVQGFIRRYAENLGLKGTDLAQQFSVDSIPSTPRPPRQTMQEDSPTTRLTRLSNAKATAADPSTASGSAMFSAGSSSPLEDSLIAASAQDGAASGAARQPANEVPLIVDDAVLEMQRSPSEPMAASNSDISDETAVEAGGFSFSQTDVFATESAQSETTNDFQSTIDRDSGTGLGITGSLPTSDLPSSEDAFANKVAEFDRQNMTPTTEPVSPSAFEAPVSNSSFDDDLPAAFTTAAADSSTTRVTPTAPSYSNAAPVGVEYDRANEPNLKPFVIGGIAAALLTAAVVALASLFGGDRTPSVADNPEPVEQASGDLETIGSETLPPIPEEAAEPASTAPLYVEAEATAEAWVSIIADGTTVFEGTLQPGDTAVWEAQETLNVYSGDAGALEISQNGESATVMGERGQPEEREFTLN